MRWPGLTLRHWLSGRPAYGGNPAECMQAMYKYVRCSAVPLPRCRYCFFACAVQLEMASSLPAGEACDVQVAAESHAKKAIKSILAIFMFPLLSPALTIS